VVVALQVYGQVQLHFQFISMIPNSHKPQLLILSFTLYYQKQRITFAIWVVIDSIGKEFLTFIAPITPQILP
jgi:hypothetical protein